jgi:type IV secretory pathway TraG/TraD family ATPase VirD4
VRDDLREAALLEMDELARAFDRSKRRALVLAAGQAPLIVERMLYFDEAMFKGCLTIEGRLGRCRICGLVAGLICNLRRHPVASKPAKYGFAAIKVIRQHKGE